MRIEIDQSGKIEQLNFDTIIAFSNNEQYCIKLPKQLKRNLFLNYKQHIKQIRYKLFSISIFLCIKEYLKINENVHLVICCEYSGKESLIKNILLELLKKNKFDISKKLITFGRIGKNSNAHNVAIDVFRENRKPNKIIQEREILELLK